MKKKYWITAVLITIYHLSMACDVCDKQQPKITAGLTHGVGPTSNWDWVNISIITAFTLLTLFLSIKYLAKPGEKNKNHIKRSILTNSEQYDETR
ncbi:MAG: hypothetical protein CMO34_04015 [Verrucomicrobia bacterium]|nr:hypothetical protein [Verrucomicrobiota bacterium]|tara:strand:+ start:497 stop:781 length:285 start_codon:yes stop_codon:yes gene_type:complete